MPQYLVSLYRPNDYDPATEDAAMHHDIDALNEEMIGAGVRVFVGGLQPTRTSKSVIPQAEGERLVEDGPYLRSDHHVGGFWVLEAADMDEAVEWGRKASLACRAPVEVRSFN